MNGIINKAKYPKSDDKVCEVTAFYINKHLYGSVETVFVAGKPFLVIEHVTHKFQNGSDNMAKFIDIWGKNMLWGRLEVKYKGGSPVEVIEHISHRVDSE